MGIFSIKRKMSEKSDYWKDNYFIGFQSQMLGEYHQYQSQLDEKFKLGFVYKIT